MIAADRAEQRPATAKLLSVDAHGDLAHLPRASFLDVLQPGDLVVANDAATIPASLPGIHVATGSTIEVRLAGWCGLDMNDVSEFAAVVFGGGDYHTRTEDRPLPPPFHPGDRLQLGPLDATVGAILGHPRLVTVKFDGTADRIWAGIADHGRPIQYAHMRDRLALWDVWTAVAGPPVAFEPPSAGFVLTWGAIDEMHRRGVGFATLTHAAGISSTGDLELDKRLPLPEPYRISNATANAIDGARERCGRIIAIGTTVVRALEHAAYGDGTVHAGRSMATQRIDENSDLSVVDAVLTGTHEPGTSHHDLLAAFVSVDTLARIDAELESHQYRTHEFGDSLMLEKQALRHEDAKNALVR